MPEYPERLWAILICPYCKGCLEKIDDGAKCSNCQKVYQYSDSGALDVRIRKRRQYQLEFELGTDLFPAPEFEFSGLQMNPSPEVDFKGIKALLRLSSELMSYFPKAKTEDSVMLDLGCGDAIHKEVCEHAGFRYVGLDYDDSSEAAILGDAHSLPFVDNSFDFVLSAAVLEHIRFPFVVMNEIYRVLRPGGKFIGTVAFLEPFHGGSFYHCTHLGIFNLLQYAGFHIEHIAPNEDWPALIALSQMVLFPKVPGLLSKYLILPTQMLHHLLWSLGGRVKRWSKQKKYERILFSAGSFYFIVKKQQGS